jgi:DNA-binding CsgD family transcriptional regulator
MQAIEDQKRLKENQLQNDLDHKESQLSALALQMLRKNELLQELNEKLEQQSQPEARQLISRELNREKEWDDFNLYFEGLNKNFFNRLKEAFPEITPNDLRICALIKMNMSIKEMAAIMNISADSVKTARYRLRKKLQLNTEDNLTEFLMKL